MQVFWEIFIMQNPPFFEKFYTASDKLLAMPLIFELSANAFGIYLTKVCDWKFGVGTKRLQKCFLDRVCGIREEIIQKILIKGFERDLFIKLWFAFCECACFV